MAGFAFTRALYAAAVVLTPGAVPRRLPFGNHAGSLHVDVAALRRLLVDSFDVSAYSCTGERTRRWRHLCVATALLVDCTARMMIVHAMKSMLAERAFAAGNNQRGKRSDECVVVCQAMPFSTS